MDDTHKLDCGHSITDLIEGPRGKSVCRVCAAEDIKRMERGPLGKLIGNTERDPLGKLIIDRAPKNPAPWPDPTPEMLKSPQFEAIWNCIMSWDINVPGVDGEGMYLAANGNHVRAILDALLTGTDQKCSECGGPYYPSTIGVGNHAGVAQSGRATDL